MEKRKDPFLFLFFLFFGSTKITTSGSKNQMGVRTFCVGKSPRESRASVFTFSVNF